MYVRDYLANDKETIPQWLKNYKIGDKLDFDEIFSHRVVYYPGAGVDGQGVRTFNRAGYAHTFLYADYGVTKEDLILELKVKGCFKGYDLYDIREISKNELMPRPWIQHVTPEDLQNISVNNQDYGKNTPYCLLVIFDRQKEYGDEYGTERFALIYLYADGIATYDALFVNSKRSPAVLICQDHGFGGNYDRFSKGGLLEKIARENSAFPKYMMAERDTQWQNYEEIADVMFEIGGMWKNKRRLFIYHT